MNMFPSQPVLSILKFTNDKGGLIVIINVSIQIDIDTENTDIEDLRDVLLDEVVEQANINPDIFVLSPVEA